MTSLLPAVPSRQRLACGEGRLHVKATDGESWVAHMHGREPMKLLMPGHRGQAVWCYISSFGGGIVAGDHIRLTVDVDANARLLLGTQAGTKVYKSVNANHLAQQDLTARVGSQGVFLNIPDPVSCFANSTFKQQQRIELAADASLFSVDWFTSGRAARNERWSFDTYVSQTDIYIDSQHIEERIYLRDSDAGPSIQQRMESVDILATVWLIGPALEHLRSALNQQLPQVMPGKQAAESMAASGSWESISPIPGGMQWRLAGYSVEAIQQRVLSVLDLCRDLAGGDPWRRRP